MKEDHINNHNCIPISVSLDNYIDKAGLSPGMKGDKLRLIYISALAVMTGVVISVIARMLVYLINLFTNLSFYHQFSFENSSPANHSYGLLVVLVPAIGGIIVGLMAFYGSKAIRGHGIPEAMEQILTNRSKIRPSIMYLKPLSSAISIGTGGPFGAEGPIIATGGALGSTVGQVLKISSYERKILLASGATAGMSTIFGTPIAAIFLAIELLLFEFSPRSIIPVALACITGAAGHHLLFEAGPVFKSPFIETASNGALALYSLIGIFIGLLAAIITKAVYFIEDLFEKLPIHWMWWPMIGGLVVGIIGYFAPRTLGVGYENITELLTGKTTIAVVLSLFIFKFISWSVALGSGTSGGTLAPLLTIGGAAGILLGSAAAYFFPQANISIPLAALLGMSAMFAGASRALLTSIIFAIETTEQANALLPMLAGCAASYVISYLLMKNTIMTEKIARRGVSTPHIYQPDILNDVAIKDVLQQESIVLSENATLAEMKEWLKTNENPVQRHYVIADKSGMFKGILSSSNILGEIHDEDSRLLEFIDQHSVALKASDNLKTAVELMAREHLDVLPIVDDENNKVAGVLSYKDILGVYRNQIDDHKKTVSISIKRRTMKILLHGRKRLSTIRVPGK